MNFKVEVKADDEMKETIDTVLSLIKEQNKIINYMANFINDNTPYTKDTRELENKQGIRTAKFTEQYFERKVKNDSRI